VNQELTVAASRDARALSEPLLPSSTGTGTGRTPHVGPQLDFPTLVRIAKEWKWLILAAAALGVAGGIVWSMLTTPEYRARVVLEVNPPSVEVFDEEEGSPASQGSNIYSIVATQVGLLNSRTLAERVAQDLNLANDRSFVPAGPSPEDRLKIATAKVAGGLAVTTPEEGNLISYTYTGTSPTAVANVANGVADAFINSSLQRRFESSAYARRFLERQIAKTRTDLERSERQLVAYAQAEGILTVGGSGGEGSAGDQSGNSLQGDSLASINKALAEAVARRVSAEGAYREARSSGPTQEVNASTAGMRQSRAALEAEYQDKRTLMKPDHPDMLSLRSRISELESQINRESAQVSGGRSNSLGQEYRAALGAERALQARVAQLKGSVLNLRGRSVRYNILQREVDTNRGLYDALLQRYKQIGVAGGVGTSPVSIVDRAEVPGGPFKPNLPFNVLAGLLIGLAVGGGSALGLEFLNDTVKTREDVRTKLALACLGAVPKRAGKGSFVEDIKDPSSGVSEAYSTIAASLRFTTESGTPKAIMVTSTSAAEGKSSTALALAQNFARRGSRVLLIDTDLRKPSFKVPNDEQGITKLLTNHEDLTAHVVPTQFDKLWLLPCGPLPPNPADLLSTGRFKAIVEEAGSHFDQVIIDAPPVLGLADAPLMAAAVVNVLFAVESGKARTRAAVEAINRLEAAGAHILGAVLTKANEKEGGYEYYSYRYGKLQDQRGDRIVMISNQPEA
jgi:capsular exopolysaccharide synthesis family protein